MTLQNTLKIVAILLAFTKAQVAFGHITLDNQAAAAGSGYKAVLRVGHGCDGAATQRLRVAIPPGFKGAKPMPKPGWVLTTRVEKLAVPYTSHGKTIAQDVVEVSWTAATAANALPDAHYDEFVLRGTLPDAPGPMWFKVLQSCTKGQNDWAEVPTSGTSTKGLKAPAALLEIQPAAAPAQAPAHVH
ncbi:MAG: YcnI family protein [Pseudomonadota bacterium]